MRAVFFAFFCLILTACQSLPSVKNLPLQQIESRSFQITQEKPMTQSSLLIVQFQPTQWRWVMVDALGSPKARLLLTKQGWQNDGFIMPNRQAQFLFTALANEIAPTEPPFELDSRWKIDKKPPHFWIRLPDESQWHIEELAQ